MDNPYSIHVITLYIAETTFPFPAIGTNNPVLNGAGIRHSIQIFRGNETMKNSRKGNEVPTPAAPPDPATRQDVVCFTEA